MPQLSPAVATSDLADLTRLAAWVDGFISRPRPAVTGHDLPVCPFTRPSMARGKLQVQLARDVDGSDPAQVLALVDTMIDVFTATTEPADTLAALVVGLPDVSPATYQTLQPAVTDHVRELDLPVSVASIAADTDVPLDTPLADVPPDRVWAPMFCLVVRNLAVADVRFLAESKVRMRLWLQVHGDRAEVGTLTDDQLEMVRQGCARHDLPLPAGMAH